MATIGTTDRADEARGAQGGSARALALRTAPIVAIVSGLLLVAAAMIHATRNNGNRRPAPVAALAGGPPTIGGVDTLERLPSATAGTIAPMAPRPLPADAPTVRFLERAPTIFANAISPHEDRGPCVDCHRIKPAPAALAANPVALVRTPAIQAMPAAAPPAAAPPLPAPTAAPAPSPGASPGVQVAVPGVDAQSGASPRIWVAAPGTAATATDRLPFQEGHWQGLEVISLSPGLARVLGLQRDVGGVVIDEVTMPADMLGFQAGDIVVAVGDVPTPDLESFIAAADVVRDKSSVQIRVVRKDEEKTLILVAERLGTANGETAPMIPPGAQRPHGYLGPCTACHRIGTKGSLPVDLGDVRALTAPVIQAGQPCPHEDRGACSACHVIQ